jgi:hypothetical protein
MRSKRGQMEIFGLAIVVVLLVLGMIFMLYFVAPKGSSKSVNVYVDNKVAHSLIRSILKINTDCNNEVMDVLVRDCAIFGEFSPEGGSINCGTVDSPKMSCDYVIDSFNEIFKMTLDVWKKPYYFKVYKDDLSNSPMFYINNPCPGEKIPGWDLVPLAPGTLTLQLDLCS